MPIHRRIRMRPVVGGAPVAMEPVNKVKILLVQELLVYHATTDLTMTILFLRRGGVSILYFILKIEMIHNRIK
jgi:hypothetical protein